MDSLPQSIILNIFSYLPYKIVQKTASLVCKVWLQISQDKSLIKYARDTEFSKVKAQNSSKETADNFRQAVEWRPCLFQSIDLSGARTTWSTFCEIVENCTGLTVLNMARMQDGLSEYPVIRAINIVELNLGETKVDDSHLALSTFNACVASGGWVPMGQGAATAIHPKAEEHPQAYQPATQPRAPPCPAPPP